MSNRRRRASRVLLAVLSLVIVVGLFTYVHRLNSSKAASSRGGGSAVATAVLPAPATTKPTESPITQAPEPTEAAVPTPQGSPQSQPQSPQPVTEAPKPHVTEAPSPTGAAEASGRGVALLATAPGTASTPSRQIDKVAAAPLSPQKVSVQALAAPTGTGTTGGTSTPTAPVGKLPTSLAGAREKAQSGRPLEARDGANALLASGHLSATDAAAARQFLAEVNQTVVFSNRRFPDDKWGGTYSVQPGDRLDRIGARFGVTPSLLMRLNGITDARRLRAGATIKVLKGPFHAVVNKNAFRLDLYLGSPAGADSVYVTSFPVGLGKDDSTPEGKWLVEPEKKIKNPVYYSPRGEGVIDADDPKNPLGEFWIGLAGVEGDARGKQSYGIHGTIEPDSIGKQSSMGCVRMRNEDVAVVFDALVEGKSTVVVVD